MTVDEFAEIAEFGELRAADGDDPFAPDDFGAAVREAHHLGLRLAVEVLADLCGVDLHTYDATAGAEHLRALFAPGTAGWVELRTKDPAGIGAKKRWIRCCDLYDDDAMQDLAGWIDRFNRRRWPVWVGIAPRADTHSGGADNLLPCQWIWADVDFKDIAGGEPEVRRRLQRFAPGPTMLVWSGNGVHCYWSLAGVARKGQGLMRAMAERIGGDAHATDSARVLRLAGTVNAKRFPPVRVRLQQGAIL